MWMQTQIFENVDTMYTRLFGDQAGQQPPPPLLPSASSFRILAETPLQGTPMLSVGRQDKLVMHFRPRVEACIWSTYSVLSH